MALYQPIVTEFLPVYNQWIKVSSQSSKQSFSFVSTSDFIGDVGITIGYSDGFRINGISTFTYLDSNIKFGDRFSGEYTFDIDNPIFQKYDLFYYKFSMRCLAVEGTSGGAGQSQSFLKINSKKTNFKNGDLVDVTYTNSSGVQTSTTGYVGYIGSNEVSVFNMHYSSMVSNLDDIKITCAPNTKAYVTLVLDTPYIPISISIGFPEIDLYGLDSAGDDMFVAKEANFTIKGRMVGGNSPAVERYKFLFYKNNILTSPDPMPEPIYQTDWIYSSNIEYNFKNIQNSTHTYVTVQAYNTYGQIVQVSYDQIGPGIIKYASDIYTDYYAPIKPISASPIAKNLCNNSNVEISWDNVRMLYGGTYPLSAEHKYVGYSEVGEFIFQGNSAIQIDSNYSLQFPRNDEYHSKYEFSQSNNMAIPMFLWYPNKNTWSGEICSVSYVGSNGRLIVSVDKGRIKRKFGLDIIDDGILQIKEGMVYLVGVTPTRAVISEYFNYINSDYEHNVLDFNLEKGKNVL